MNVDETQLLENNENNGVTGTLVLKEVNINEEVKETVQISTETLDKNVSNKAELSNYCLKLVNPEKSGKTENVLLPLFLGLNKIGRSNKSEICILDKNVSKSHVKIDVTESPVGELTKCVLTDDGAMNKIKVNNDKVLNKNESSTLKLNNTVLIGLTLFKISKMTESERAEQKENRTNFLDLWSSPKKQNGSTNGTANGKLNNLFEIQNTLDDTCLIESTNGSDTHENEKFYVADTDPEDEDENETDMSSSIHLEMHETINQSAFSNKTSTSLYIPDTMDYSYEENEACDKANESMPPPAVPSLKMNGTKNTRDITQEKADTALSSDVDKKHLEDAKQKIEEDQAEVIVKEGDINAEINGHTVKDQQEESETSSSKENGSSEDHVASDIEPTSLEEKNLENSSPNKFEVDTQIIVEKEASVGASKESEKVTIAMKSVPVNTDCDIGPASEPKTAAKSPEKLTGESTDKRESILSNKSEAREDLVVGEENMEINDETRVSENEIIPPTPSQSQQPQITEETPEKTVESVEQVVLENEKEKILEVSEETEKTVESVSESSIVEQEKTEKVVEPVVEPSIEKTVETKTSPSLKKSESIEIAKTGSLEKKSLNKKQKPATDEIMVESTMFDPSQAKYMDQSQPLNSDDYPESDEEEQQGEKTAVKSRGRPARGAAIKKETEHKYEENTPAAMSVRRSARAPTATPKATATPSVKPTRGRKKQSLEPQNEESEQTEADKESHEAEDPSEAKASKRGRRKAVEESAPVEPENPPESTARSEVEEPAFQESVEAEPAVNKKVEPTKRGRRKTNVTEDVPAENQAETSAGPEVEAKITKKAEPVKRGRRKTNVTEDKYDVPAENQLVAHVDPEAEEAASQETVEAEPKRAEPAKRGRRKAVVNSDDIAAAKKEVVVEEEQTVNEAEIEAKKAEPYRKGRRKTATISTEEVRAAEATVTASTETENLENIKEVEEEKELSKAEPAKRGRKKATVTVNPEDIAAVTPTAAAEVAEASSAPARPTLARRASLRARPAASVSTPKEPVVKKTVVKTIEESPIKLPAKAKVTRRNSVAVTSTKKASPTKVVSKRAKALEEGVDADVEEKEEDEKKEVAPEAEKVAKKTTKKEPVAKGRRQTISVVTEDVTEAVAAVEGATKKAAKSPKTAKKVDTYSYEDSDKSGPESEGAKKKSTKKKRNQGEMEADENEKNKKLKAKNAQTESDSDQETLATKKKRAQKRKSIEAAQVADEVATTPKLFFQSKRVKTTPPNGISSKEPNKTVYSPFVNTPSKACNLNTSTANGNFNASINAESPNKKFKLFSKNMKSSSSSENNSSDEEAANVKKEEPISKKMNKSGLKSSLATNSPNDTVNKSTVSKHVSIKLPNEKEAKKINGSAANAELLNKTTDNIEVKPKVKPVKSARHSLGNIRGSSGVPKIMTTGIMLTEKEKKIIENLGGEIVTDVRECTHLITNKIRKTFKFLSCLARSVHIIGDRWLEESNKNKMFLNPITYSLNDKVTEKHYKFNLETSLLKSKSNPLLQDWTFLLKYEDSPEEELTFNNIKVIIECAGGKLWESINNKLPKDSQILAKFCIIYENKERYVQDTKNADAKVPKIYLDTLLTCVLKQAFDNSCMIDQTAEALAPTA